jgi:glucosamine--fructose-6-phosphate aminotransferase (isomerizing)
MGSSLFALHPLHALLTSRGFTTLLVETSELVYYLSRLLDCQTLIIAVSQSGRSAEIIRLLDENARRAPIIAVTNTDDSPLALQADSVFLTRAGQEFSVSCKTYVTALMALRHLGSLLTNAEQVSFPRKACPELAEGRESTPHTLSDGPEQTNASFPRKACPEPAEGRESTQEASGEAPDETISELAQAAPAVRRYLDFWRDHVVKLSACLEGVRHLFLLGRGGSLAAVGTGALTIKESTHRHAEGMSSAAFRHGPVEMLSEETFVIVFAGDEKTRALNTRLFEDIRQKGGRAELLGKDAQLSSLRIPEVPESALPILEILPAQMVSLALAAQTGREAGRFTLGSKVTTIE